MPTPCLPIGTADSGREWCTTRGSGIRLRRSSSPQRTQRKFNGFLASVLLHSGESPLAPCRSPLSASLVHFYNSDLQITRHQFRLDISLDHRPINRILVIIEFELKSTESAHMWLAARHRRVTRRPCGRGEAAGVVTCWRALASMCTRSLSFRCPLHFASRRDRSCHVLRCAPRSNPHHRAFPAPLPPSAGSFRYSGVFLDALCFRRSAAVVSHHRRFQ